MSSFLVDYTKLDELGQGGFAKVYKVRHNKLGYIRAIRVLNEFIANGEQDSIYQRFLEECKILLRLGNGNHPHIVHIYQPLLKEQRALVEMDYVDGCNITTYLERNNRFVKADDVIKLLSDMSSALAYCHEDIFEFCYDRMEDNLMDDPEDGSKVIIDAETRKTLINKYRVIHNDLHSGNIIRRGDGNFILLDFGLAIEGDDVVRSSRRRNGAPEYMAPEKWDNNKLLSTQSDIYSLGVILYEYLSGQVPFKFDKANTNSTEAIYKLSQAHKSVDPSPIFALRKAAFEAAYPGETMDEPDYPEWLENVILKCLSKNPDDRFYNGKELFNYVSQILSTSNTGDCAALREENIELQQKVAKLQDDSDSYAKALNDKIDELKTQLHDAKRSRNKYVTRSKDLSAENDLLKKEIENLQAATAGEDVSLLKNKLNQANEKINQLIEEVNIASSSPKSGGVVWKVLSGLFFVAFIAVAVLYAGKLTEITHSVDSTEYEQVLALNDSLNRQNKELLLSVEQLDETQAQLDEYALLIAQRDSIIQVRDSVINNYGENVSDNDTQIATLQREVARLNRELRTAKDKILSLNRRNKEMENRILELL